jgi:hypothetical protein
MTAMSRARKPVPPSISAGPDFLRPGVAEHRAADARSAVLLRARWGTHPITLGAAVKLEARAATRAVHGHHTRSPVRCRGRLGRTTNPNADGKVAGIRRTQAVLLKRCALAQSSTHPIGVAVACRALGSARFPGGAVVLLRVAQPRTAVIEPVVPTGKSCLASIGPHQLTVLKISHGARRHARESTVLREIALLPGLTTHLSHRIAHERIGVWPSAVCLAVRGARVRRRRIGEAGIRSVCSLRIPIDRAAHV